MLTAIIAEDEQKVGQLIKALIKWDELNISLLGIINNGKDAFDFIKQNKPDIVITDIRMPKMDGLELIRQTKILYPEIKFIVISGYRYFEYAHSALKYGVVDYLLKPINQDDLNNILRKICEEKEKNLQQKQNETQMQHERYRSRSILHRELIDKILDHNQNTGNLANVNEVYSLSLKDEFYQAVTIKLDHKRADEEYDERQDSLVLEKLADMVKSVVKPNLIDYIITIRESWQIVCIFNFIYENHSALNKSYGLLLSSMQDYIYAFNEYEITMGIGHLVNSFGKIRNSLASALKALQYRIKLGTGRKINIDDYNFNNMESPALLIKKHQANIVNIVESFDCNRLKSVIELVFKCVEYNESVEPSIYYELAEEFVKLFFEHVQFNDSEIISARKDILKAIHNRYTLKALQNLLEKRLCELLNKLMEKQSAMVNKPIRDAKLYIAKHYAEKIVLEDIAQLVNLNPTYFSVVFKKETGSNFSDYLINVRMEEAKALLRESNETILVIAEKVGYKDPKYFSQLFTKTVGIKPNNYRKLYS